MAVSTNGWAHLMQWDGSNWQWVWGNGGTGNIALWSMKTGDQYFAGDFEGDGRADLLAVSTNGWVHLMKWNGSNWQWVWGNGGTGNIALWSMKASDQYFVGDFDGDGQADLMAVSTNGWAHLMKWTGNDGQWVWGNGSSGKIALWYMNSGDRYVGGISMGMVGPTCWQLQPTAGRT